MEQLIRGLRRPNWLRLLLILSVLGMEACWLAPWVPLVGEIAEISFPRHSILLVYVFLLLAFFGQWIVRSVEFSWIVRSALLGALMMASALIFLWIELYVAYPFLSWGWIRRLGVSLLDIPKRLPPEMLLLILSGYIWYRSLVTAEATMLTDMVSARFRSGFLALTFYSYVALIGQGDIPWELFIFFFLAGISAASARLLESKVGLRGWELWRRWLVLLLGSATLTVGVGVVGLLILSPRNLRRVSRALAPFFNRVRYLFSYLVAYIYYALEWLIGTVMDFFADRPLPRQMQPPSPPSLGGDTLGPTGPTWLPAAWNVIGQILIWGLVLLALVWLVRRILRRRRVRGWSEGVERESLRMQPASLAENLREGWQRVVERVRQIGLPPRYSAQSIRRIYASLVAYAGQLGHVRSDSETPFDFLPDLRHLFPEREADVDRITDAYVRVHYGQFPETQEEFREVYRSWERLQAQGADGEDEGE